jgi:DNA replication factor GINS
MHLDELRNFLLSERESGRLIQVPPDLYEKIAGELEVLTKEVEGAAAADPFSDQTRYLLEEVGSLRETIHDLFRTRSEKILALAHSHVEIRHADREELRKMLAPERAMFDGIIGVIEECRTELLRETPRSALQAPDEAPVEKTHTGIPRAVPPPGFSLVRVMSEIEPFMGVDGRVYQLAREDLAVIPSRNADVLNERKIVATIDLPVP